MKTILATLGIAVTSAIGDIDRTMWMTPEEIDSSGSREIVEQRGSAAQKRSLEIYRKEIAGCDQLPPDKAFPILWDAVFKLPKYNIYQLKERIEVFDLARDKLFSLPGHSEYFADLIEKERAAIPSWDTTSSYDRHRSWYLVHTLKHMPSPETVRVLGRYLEDDRDMATPEEQARHAGVGPNSSCAAMCLDLIGLRNPPDYPPDGWIGMARPAVEAARAWFAPIKSGEKPFSFKGQAVEYRFKPDGTWTTTPIANPPDDAPKPPAANPPPAPAPGPVTPPPPAAPAAEAPGKPMPLWPWIAAVLALLAGLGWVFKGRGKPAP